MGNYKTHQKIGSYTNISINDTNFDNIIFTCDDLFHNTSGVNLKYTKNKVVLDLYIIFYTIKNSETFYSAVVQKNSVYFSDEKLIFEFFEDIDHQGIKKLIGEDGALSKVGRQNLGFCIEIFQESSKKNYKKKRDVGDKDTYKALLLPNEEKIIKQNDIEFVDKNEDIKENPNKFVTEPLDIEKEIKFKYLMRKILIFCVIFTFFLTVILLYLMLKK